MHISQILKNFGFFIPYTLKIKKIADDAFVCTYIGGFQSISFRVFHPVINFVFFQNTMDLISWYCIPRDFGRTFVDENWSQIDGCVDCKKWRNIRNVMYTTISAPKLGYSSEGKMG